MYKNKLTIKKYFPELQEAYLVVCACSFFTSSHAWERTNEMWRTISPATPSSRREAAASLRAPRLAQRRIFAHKLRGEFRRCEARLGADDGSELLGLEEKEGRMERWRGREGERKGGRRTLLRKEVALNPPFSATRWNARAEGVFCCSPSPSLSLYVTGWFLSSTFPCRASAWTVEKTIPSTINK